MSKKQKKKDYKRPSSVLMAASLHSGSGKHTESRKERDARTGRLRNEDKRKLMEEY